uniref:Uncharacterized protein n=1 Tax=Nelumbo nucifera TaxID=4432 RepID=A0A822Z2F9_NELNU|nr:TPA_asm: hypothetical protein HUJ06_013535 [Nelumbo nucifera]
MTESEQIDVLLLSWLLMNLSSRLSSILFLQRFLRCHNMSQIAYSYIDWFSVLA